MYIDFHLVLPRDYSLEEAHSEVKELEKLIAEHFGGAASLLIHTDPCIDPDCPVCRRHLCGLRQKEYGGAVSWKWETLIQQGGVGERSERVEEEFDS